MSSTDSKNPNRVAGGYNATMHNPNTSQEAKQSAKERLEEMEPDLQEFQRRSATDQTADKNLGNVIGGHKATLSNPKTSEGAKQHSRQFLKQVDGDEEGLGDTEYVPEKDD